MLFVGFGTHYRRGSANWRAGGRHPRDCEGGKDSLGRLHRHSHLQHNGEHDAWSVREGQMDAVGADYEGWRGGATGVRGLSSILLLLFNRYCVNGFTRRICFQQTYFMYFQKAGIYHLESVVVKKFRTINCNCDSWVNPMSHFFDPKYFPMHFIEGSYGVVNPAPGNHYSCGRQRHLLDD